MKSESNFFLQKKKKKKKKKNKLKKNLVLIHMQRSVCHYSRQNIDRKWKSSDGSLWLKLILSKA